MDDDLLGAPASNVITRLNGRFQWSSAHRWARRGLLHLLVGSEDCYHPSTWLITDTNTREDPSSNPRGIQLADNLKSTGSTGNVAIFPARYFQVRPFK